MTLSTATELTALAARHGLELDASTMTLEEVGLDFRVGIARTSTGETWVLRIPRRAGMDAQIAAEGAILDFVAAQGIVAVPRWTIRSSELIAYRAVQGDPGLKIDAEGQLHWRLDPSSLRYAEAFGALLAKLHGVDVERAREVGVEVEAPGEVRARRGPRGASPHPRSRHGWRPAASARARSVQRLSPTSCPERRWHGSR